MPNYTLLPIEQLEFLPIAPLDELPNGERLFVSIENVPIVIFNIAGGLFAIEDTCTHDGNPLDDAPLEGHAVICPRHGARFDVRDGKALAMPAVEDVDAYPVRVVDGQIELGWPK
jgi:3-phenylpropionate/trans-cinnamate dioxygenase ferredoxin component